MIKNIFIPTKIRSFYIFTERIAAIEITQTQIIAVLVIAHGKRRTIDGLVKEPISQDPALSYQERAVGALRTVVQKLGKYTELIALIPSISVVFKELSVPLLSEKKMKMIVPFEVEQLLPFPLNEASIDSIIVGRNATTHKAHLFAAAVKQDLLANHLAIYEAAKLVPDRISTDIFELYGLYETIPEYQAIKGTVVLLNIEQTTTRMLLIKDHELQAVRVIPQGLLLHNASVDQNSLKSLAREVTMTLNTLSGKLETEPSAKVVKAIICGRAADIKDITQQMESELHITCEILSVQKVLHQGTIVGKNGLSNEFIIPLATALTSNTTEDFNLNQQLAQLEENKIISGQIIVSAILIITVLSAFMINSIFTSRSLSAEIKASEGEAITLLQRQLGLTIAKDKKTGTVSLDTVNAQANNEIVKKENIWFALSSENRFSFLAYLQELSTRINREAIGLELRQLSVSKDTDTMTLEGQVKNFEALRMLEEELNQSTLFQTVSKPQDLKFTIKIVLNKTDGQI